MLQLKQREFLLRKQMRQADESADEVPLGTIHILRKSLLST